MNKTFNKLIKTNIALAVLSVFAVVIMIGGVSYALFFQKIESKSEAAFHIGNLEADLSSSTGMIVLSDIFPTNAADIGNNNLYSFTITNNGDYPLDYTIYLSDNTVQYKAAHSEYSSYTALSTSNYQYIDYKLDDGVVSNLSSIYNATTKRMVLLTGTIAGGGTIETHTIQFWLDNGDTTANGAPNSVAGSMLAVNINLEGVAKGVKDTVILKMKRLAKPSTGLDYSVIGGSNTISSVTDDNFSKEQQTYTVDTTHQSYYMTYADSYTFNSPTTTASGSNYPTYTLTNPQVAKYSDIYGSLIGKYIVNYEGHNSSTVAYSGDLYEQSSGLDRIYKVVSATATSITYKPSSYTMTFADNGTTGVYTAEDENNTTSYYFRGNVADNYVKFGKWTEEVYRGYNYDQSAYKEYFTSEACKADETYNYDCNKSPVAGKDMYWRIVRINGDGTLRLIYDGTEAHANGKRSLDRVALPKQQFNSAYNSNAYVGYMYGDINGTDPSTVHANTNPSAIKTALETWYEKNFVGTEYANKVGDMSFCNDRSIVTHPDYGTGTGVGTTETYYGAYERLALHTRPSLICPQKDNDLFTSDAITQGGNGKIIDKPVGLLTADEGILAGGVYKNRNFYINKGYAYWLGTPANYSSFPYEYYVDRVGIMNIGIVDDTHAVVPVINLSAEAANQLIGSGTMEDPYTL